MDSIGDQQGYPPHAGVPYPDEYAAELAGPEVGTVPPGYAPAGMAQVAQMAQAVPMAPVAAGAQLAPVPQLAPVAPVPQAPVAPQAPLSAPPRAYPASGPGPHTAQGSPPPDHAGGVIGVVAPRSAPDAGYTPAAVPAASIGPDRRPGVPDVTERDLDLHLVLEHMLEVGASDLHLSVGSPPLARVDGHLGTLDGFGDLSQNGIQRAVYAILTQKQRERFETELELDLAYALPGKARFRVNLYRQREALGAAFRRIPFEIRTLEELGMPPVVSTFAGLTRGLVLVTGPTGSGKSTTLASVVDLANRTRHDHILTVEDPIEFLHRHKGCLVNQREVGEDTHSFGNALRHALRQDPDILLVGEMRDLETISVALTAAETGHLVLATLHTQDAAQTIDRIIDVFPPHQQQQVRTQLAGVLQGVVCQTLCPQASGRGRVVATEVLIATPAIRNLIREGKAHQVYSALQAGAQFGMHTLDQHLAELYRRREITRDTAMELCHHREDFLRLIGER